MYACSLVNPGKRDGSTVLRTGVVRVNYVKVRHGESVIPKFFLEESVQTGRVYRENSSTIYQTICQLGI
jgi:hypothetical protein